MIPPATRAADRRRTALLAGAVGTIGLLATAALGWLGAEEYIAAVVAAAATGAVVMTQLRIMRHLQQGAAWHYRQIEALSGIYSSLRIRAPLPPMRDHAMSPDFARELVAQVLAEKPRTVVELGSGVSTVLTGHALESIGNSAAHLYSLDHEAQFAGITRRNLAAHGLTNWATVLDAPLVGTTVDGEQRRWYDISSLEAALGNRKIDLLVVDGPPARDDAEARAPALHALRSRLADRAIILMDDAGRPGERRIVQRWLQSEPGLEAQWLPVEKGAAILRFSSDGEAAAAARASREVESKPTAGIASATKPA